MSREELLREVEAIAAAARRRDIAAVLRHHDRLLELVERHVPSPSPERTACPECGIGGGYHLEDCNRGQLEIATARADRRARQAHAVRVCDECEVGGGLHAEWCSRARAS